MPVTAYTRAALTTELHTDPANLGYAAILAGPNPDTLLAALINDVTKGTPMPQPVPMAVFAAWAATNGTRQKLKNGSSNATYGALCDTALDAFGELTLPFDPTNTLFANLWGQLVTSGVLSATDDVAAAMTFCTTLCSRAQNLWSPTGIVIPVDEIRLAR